MPIDVESLSDVELKTLIANHRRKNATHAPLFLQALRELELRIGKGMDFEKSFAIIREAAQHHRFLSYKELADASGADWKQVHYKIGGHLWKLVEYAHYNRWPMLSAIVVNKQHVETGLMEPDTLKGLIGAAGALGHDVADKQSFLRAQQQLVFAWASAAGAEQRSAP